MGRVVAVSRSARHEFSKEVQERIQIVAGLGVEGDAHAGVTVQHLYRARQNPKAPNRTQVHLLGVELFAELAGKGIAVGPGEMGENIVTEGLDLLGLPLGTRLRLGASAVVELTGLRTPCRQMDGLRAGLMQACLGRHADGSVMRRAGVMGIAVVGGEVVAGNAVSVELPVGQHRALPPV